MAQNKFPKSASKRALLISSEYVTYSRQGKTQRLPGCHTDMWRMRTLLLERYGFLRGDVKLVADYKPHLFPTRHNILYQLHSLASECQANPAIQHVFIYYSGHGTQIPASPSDTNEADLLDECIVPCDYRQAPHYITDNDIYLVLARFPAHVKLLFISDSCNSGTVSDLGYLWDIKTQSLKPIANSHDTVQAQIITISGCRDDQTSASVYKLSASRTWRGGATIAFESAMNLFPREQASFHHIVQEMHSFLKKYNLMQIPQCCASLSSMNLNEINFYTFMGI